MALHVHELTKQFGRQLALDAISFSVREGEIVGFLGPNGAGKSTTMKIATGFLPATSGVVTVGGKNVADNPMSVKKMIGYLPEHNPLYLDMFVHEFLHFVGGLYGLSGKALTLRVREMIGMCGLEREQNKKLESLSKGYRQRVGLAQALIHNPEVLILDEPTSGLDPNQIVEIRKLIKEVSTNKTVIFSTHIMQEVEALCDRVVVINRGKIVADSRLSELMSQQQDEEVIVVEFKETVATEMIEALGVLEVEQRGSQWRIRARKQLDVRSVIMKLASDHHLSLLSLSVEAHSLEEVFRSLTNASTPS